MIIVSLEGDGNYTSIQEAINSITNTTSRIIFIKNGIYREKLHLMKSNLTLIGEDEMKTVITFDDYAKKELEDGTTMQTFRSYSTFIHGNHLTFMNLTFENNAGKGSEVGQGIASYVDGDCIHFKNCRFIGHQDTLFTAPLPPAPVIPGSFIGPGEHLPKTVGRHYYENCYIQGDIDFIFGSATAYFEKCTLYSNSTSQYSYITAASTPSNESYGYVFHQCQLIGDANKNSVFLGRPWREFAHVVYLNCYLGPHIHEAGWDDWNKPHDSLKFYEFQNTGPGSNRYKRVTFCKELSPKQASHYTKEKILKDFKPYKKHP